jgi:D-arabinose 1-dehydrogenase-like Zn-dependent alcohol dehydrogenase
MGAQAKGLTVGQRVGIGWTAASCMHCRQCLSGHQHLCPQAVPTILGHAGGFAEVVRVHWAWAVPLPDALAAAAAGPLLCAGVTVFAPLAAFDVAPTSRVGVVDFAARHGVAPEIERFPMTRVNDALTHLRAGRAHYRVVLDADFAAWVRSIAA